MPKRSQRDEEIESEDEQIRPKKSARRSSKKPRPMEDQFLGDSKQAEVMADQLMEELFPEPAAQEAAPDAGSQFFPRFSPPSSLDHLSTENSGFSGRFSPSALRATRPTPQSRFRTPNGGRIAQNEFDHDSTPRFRTPNGGRISFDETEHDAISSPFHPSFDTDVDLDILLDLAEIAAVDAPADEAPLPLAAAPAAADAPAGPAAPMPAPLIPAPPLGGMLAGQLAAAPPPAILAGPIIVHPDRAAMKDRLLAKIQMLQDSRENRKFHHERKARPRRHHDSSSEEDSDEDHYDEERPSRSIKAKRDNAMASIAGSAALNAQDPRSPSFYFYLGKKNRKTNVALFEDVDTENSLRANIERVLTTAKTAFPGWEREASCDSILCAVDCFGAYFRGNFGSCALSVSITQITAALRPLQSTEVGAAVKLSATAINGEIERAIQELCHNVFGSADATIRIDAMRLRITPASTMRGTTPSATMPAASSSRSGPAPSTSSQQRFNRYTALSFPSELCAISLATVTPSSQIIPRASTAADAATATAPRPQLAIPAARAGFNRPRAADPPREQRERNPRVWNSIPTLKFALTEAMSRPTVCAEQQRAASTIAQRGATSSPDTSDSVKHPQRLASTSVQDARTPATRPPTAPLYQSHDSLSRRTGHHPSPPPSSQISSQPSASLATLASMSATLPRWQPPPSTASPAVSALHPAINALNVVRELVRKARHRLRHANACGPLPDSVDKATHYLSIQLQLSNNSLRAKTFESIIKAFNLTDPQHFWYRLDFTAHDSYLINRANNLQFVHFLRKAWFTIIDQIQTPARGMPTPEFISPSSPFRPFVSEITRRPYTFSPFLGMWKDHQAGTCDLLKANKIAQAKTRTENEKRTTQEFRENFEQWSMRKEEILGMEKDSTHFGTFDPKSLETTRHSTLKPSPIRAFIFEELTRNCEARTEIEFNAAGIKQGYPLGIPIVPATLEFSPVKNRPPKSESEFELTLDDIQAEVKKGRLIPLDQLKTNQVLENPVYGINKKFCGIPISPAKIRRITNLSARHRFGLSTNEMISIDFSTVKYITWHEVNVLVNVVGFGGWLVKIDLAEAYRQLPIRPEDWHFLGMNYNGTHYVDTREVFGDTGAGRKFNNFADAIEWIGHTHAWVEHFIHFLDDFITGHKTRNAPLTHSPQHPRSNGRPSSNAKNRVRTRNQRARSGLQHNKTNSGNSHSKNR
jgi:hypothetical protein